MMMELGLKEKARFFRENSLLRKAKIIREAWLKRGIGKENKLNVSKSYFPISSPSDTNKAVLSGNDLEKLFEELQAVYSVSEVLRSSPRIEEVIFFTFSTLENKLGIKKMFLVTKQDNVYKVFDSYGFTEDLHHRLCFDENSQLFKIVSKEKYVDIMKESTLVGQYFSPYDIEEMNVCIFIPLKIYGRVLGFFGIGAIDPLDNYEWKVNLYQLLASYFTTILYISSFIPIKEESSKSIDINSFLENIFSEQILKARASNNKVFFAFVKQRQKTSSIGKFSPYFINILGDYKLLTYIFQSDSSLPRFIETLREEFEILSTSLDSSGEKTAKEILYELGLVNR